LQLRAQLDREAIVGRDEQRALDQVAGVAELAAREVQLREGRERLGLAPVRRVRGRRPGGEGRGGGLELLHRVVSDRGVRERRAEAQ
jgi:hypothetical protein